MNASPRNRWIPWIAAITAVLWTLTMALAYGLLAFTDDVARWIHGLFDIPADVVGWLTAAGTWLEQWGPWLLVVIWALGLIALLLLSWFAHQLIRWFLGSASPGRETGQ